MTLPGIAFLKQKPQIFDNIYCTLKQVFKFLWHENIFAPTFL